MNRIVSGIAFLIALTAALHAQAPAPAGNVENGKAVFLKA